MTAVIVVGLDAIWDGIAGGDPVIHGIKIDVQGMELDALRGMWHSLSRHRPRVILEIHRGVPRDEVLSVLESCGYLVDPEPIDDALGAFADPQSNASFIFQASPFSRDEPHVHASRQKPFQVTDEARVEKPADPKKWPGT